MAIAVIDTVTNSVVKDGFGTKGEAIKYAKAREQADAAIARLDYWDRTQFPSIHPLG